MQANKINAKSIPRLSHRAQSVIAQANGTFFDCSHIQKHTKDRVSVCINAEQVFFWLVHQHSNDTLPTCHARTRLRKTAEIKKRIIVNNLLDLGGGWGDTYRQ